MAIDFACPNCQRMLRVPDEAAGKQAQCPQCNTVVDVPAAAVGAAQQPPSDASAKQPLTEFPFSNQPYQPPSQAFQPQPFSAPLPPPAVAGESNPFAAPSFRPQPSANPVDSNPFSSPSMVSPASDGFGAAEFEAAKAKLGPPAVGMMIVAILTWLVWIALLVNGYFNGHRGQQWQPGELHEFLLGSVVIMIPITVACGLQLLGAFMMRRLTSYAFSMVGAVFTMISSPCCGFLTLPIGIWAVYVLLNADVRLAYQNGPQGYR